MAERKKLEIAKGAMVVTPPSYVFGEKGAKKQANITSWLGALYVNFCDSKGILCLHCFAQVCVVLRVMQVGGCGEEILVWQQRADPDFISDTTTDY